MEHKKTGNLNELLTEVMLAESLGVSPRTLQYWRSTSEGPKWIALGRLVRYDTEDVAAWLEDRKVSSTIEKALKFGGKG